MLLRKSVYRAMDFPSLSHGLTRYTSSVLLLLPLAVLHADDKVDLAVVHQVKTEAFKSSHVMDHLFH